MLAHPIILKNMGEEISGTLLWLPCKAPTAAYSVGDQGNQGFNVQNRCPPPTTLLYPLERSIIWQINAPQRATHTVNSCTERVS